MSAMDRTIFSFIVDDDPIFLNEGCYLARSLIEHCADDPSAIVVQFTPEVPEARGAIFRDLGCRVLRIANSATAATATNSTSSAISPLSSLTAPCFSIPTPSPCRISDPS